MEEARRELGGDAILVTSRLAPAEAGKPRQYEVVFASETAAKNVPEPRNVSPQASTLSQPSTALGPHDSVLKEVREIRMQLDALKQSSGRHLDEARWISEPAAKELFALLIRAEVDPDLAQQILASAMKRNTKTETGGRFFEVLKAASAQLASPVKDIRTAQQQSKRSAMCFAQRPASTAIRTTRLSRHSLGLQGQERRPLSRNLRFATEYSSAGRRYLFRRIQFVWPQRSNSEAMLRCWDFDLSWRHPHVPSRAQILEDHRGTGLVLIDTPGFSPYGCTRAI